MLAPTAGLAAASLAAAVLAFKFAAAPGPATLLSASGCHPRPEPRLPVSPAAPDGPLRMGPGSYLASAFGGLFGSGSAAEEEPEGTEPQQGAWAAQAALGGPKRKVPGPFQPSDGQQPSQGGLQGWGDLRRSKRCVDSCLGGCSGGRRAASGRRQAAINQRWPLTPCPPLKSAVH